MSGAAEILIERGYSVSGSDIVASTITDKLKKKSARILIGHSSQNIGDAEIVVYSSAIDVANPEIREAQKRGIPLISRGEALAELMKKRYGIAVAGAHGKTTTSAMISTVLTLSGIDPTFIVGGIIRNFDTNARAGESRYFTAEADESDKSFLFLAPTISVVTSIDDDHLDRYRDLDELKACFLAFINKTPIYGASVLCIDDERVREIIGYTRCPVITYGAGDISADYNAEKIEFTEGGAEFSAFRNKRELGRVFIPLYGKHMVQNALAVIAVCLEIGLSMSEVKSALRKFKGVSRRFEYKGSRQEVIVIDDYGHHPTEIKAVLGALRRKYDRKLTVVFQPHRYSRTSQLMTQFAAAFREADEMFLLDIYSAGEKAVPGVTSEILADEIRKTGQKNVHYFEERDLLLEELLQRSNESSVLLTLGAGDVYKIGEQFLVSDCP